LYGLALAKGRDSTLFTLDDAVYLRSSSSSTDSDAVNDRDKDTDTDTDIDKEEGDGESLVGTDTDTDTDTDTNSNSNSNSKRNSAPAAESHGKLLAIRSFLTEDSYTENVNNGNTNIVHVTKRKGMEHLSLLDKVGVYMSMCPCVHVSR
tara:strand:- start:1 stop:447 length:447 start_codon:yes stop_codon:yes gene_type:complete